MPSVLDTFSDPSKLRWHPDSLSGLDERIVVTGRLVFDAPLRIGNGDAADEVDHTLLRDAKGCPLVTGASLAGALRALLNRYDSTTAALLFGSDRYAGEAMTASPLLVADATFDGEAVRHEVRTGVGLDGRSRTAAPGLLYNFEVWPAGLILNLRLELSVPHADTDAGKRRQALAALLQHLEEHGLDLGARTSRGYGHARVEDLRVERHKATDRAALVARLRRAKGPEAVGKAFAERLGVKDVPELQASVFALEIPVEVAGGGLLVRNGKGGSSDTADALYFGHDGTKDNRGQPVIPGTSLAGALRAHSRRIAHFLSGETPPAYDALEPKKESKEHDERTSAEGIVRGLFGAAPSTTSSAKMYRSRLKVRESAVENGNLDHVQPRVSIDRFTGGSFPGALFMEQPVVGKATATLRLEVPRPVEKDVRKPAMTEEEHRQAIQSETERVEKQWAAEKGLLLLLVKDLVAGLLPLGGTQSVGRGRFKAAGAVRVSDGGQTTTLDFSKPDEPLEGYVKALYNAFAPTSNG